MKQRILLIVVGWMTLVLASEALAFPPYRSTDAETADPWTLETRFGLVRVRRDQSTNAFSTPLWRANLGLPHQLELITEGEWSASDGRLGDAAVGLKWVPWLRTFSLGVEALALVPISAQGGAGAEVQILATQRFQPMLLHFNGGGFYDARPAEVERGWRASLLAEALVGRWRPGLEIFAKQVNGGPVTPLAGAGVIVRIGPIDLRTGVHVGLVDASPDLVASFWMASKFPLR